MCFVTQVARPKEEIYGKTTRIKKRLSVSNSAIVIRIKKLMPAQNFLSFLSVKSVMRLWRIFAHSMVMEIKAT